MCKHVKNVQTQILAKCCKRWFDCAECHREQSDHEIEKDIELILVCKKCKKVFRIDVRSSILSLTASVLAVTTSGT